MQIKLATELLLNKTYEKYWDGSDTFRNNGETGTSYIIYITQKPKLLPGNNLRSYLKYLKIIYMGSGIQTK